MTARAAGRGPTLFSASTPAGGARRSTPGSSQGDGGAQARRLAWGRAGIAIRQAEIRLKRQLPDEDG